MGNVQRILNEIEMDLHSTWWARVPLNDDAKCYRGHGSAWTFSVVDFDIEPQGFPKGSRGQDGSASRSGLVVHLTRELSRRAVELAQEQLGESR